MGIKIGVFDAAEYGGVVEFSLKPLPSKKNIIFHIFLEKKIKKCQKMIFFSPGRGSNQNSTTPPYSASSKTPILIPLSFFEKNIFFPKNGEKRHFFTLWKSFTKKEPHHRIQRHRKPLF